MADHPHASPDPTPEEIAERAEIEKANHLEMKRRQRWGASSAGEHYRASPPRTVPSPTFRRGRSAHY